MFAASPRLILALLLPLLLTACDQKELIRRLTPEADDKLAREFIEHVRAGRVDQSAAMLDPALPKEEAKKGLGQLFGLFKGGEVKRLDVVGVNTFSSTTETTVNLSYEMELTTGWFAGAVAIVRAKSAPPVIRAARFDAIPGPMEQTNALNLSNKGLIHFIFLGLVMFIPLLILFALVMCARTPMRQKWLWIIFILLGVGSLNLNWTTGEFSIGLLHIRLLGAGFAKMAPAAPWIFSISAPVGAVLFLSLRRMMIIAPPAPPAPPPLPQ
jgi:hypothetical protein